MASLPCVQEPPFHAIRACPLQWGGPETVLCAVYSSRDLGTGAFTLVEVKLDFFFYFGCLVWFWFSGVFCLVGCFYFSKQGFSEPWRSSIDQAGLNRDTPPSAGNKDMFHHPAKVKTLNIKTEKFRTNQYEAKLEFIIQFIRFKHKGL